MKNVQKAIALVMAAILIGTCAMAEEVFTPAAPVEAMEETTVLTDEEAEAIAGAEEAEEEIEAFAMIEEVPVAADSETAEEIPVEEETVVGDVVEEVAEETAEPLPEATIEPTPAPAPEATAEPAPEATIEPTPIPTPEATTQPTPEATPELTPTPAPEVTPEPVVPAAPAEEELPEETSKLTTIIDALDPNRSITIYYVGDTNVSYGDVVKLRASVKGYENVTYTLQWQSSVDNDTWKDVGDNSTEYSFVLDEENSTYYWRVSVSISDVNE